MDVERADLVPDGWELWASWYRVCERLPLPEMFPGSAEVMRRESEALERDRGRTLGFSRVVARRPVRTPRT